jgi:hypothetical protein
MKKKKNYLVCKKNVEDISIYLKKRNVIKLVFTPVHRTVLLKKIVFGFFSYYDIDIKSLPLLVKINLCCRVYKMIISLQPNFLGMRELEIELLTICLRRSKPLALEPIYC